MKILIGSHGTGKTTLLKEVSTRFPDYYVTDGFSRPVLKIGRMLELSNNEKQYAINELSAWAYENYLKHKNVISTRSLVDCIIYSQILTPDVDIENLITLFEETKDQVDTIDTLLKGIAEKGITTKEALAIALVVGVEWDVKFVGVR